MRTTPPRRGERKFYAMTRKTRIAPVKTHICARCQKWLPVADFRPNPKLMSGISSWCRACHAERTRQWRAANPAYNARRRELYAKRRAALSAVGNGAA
jgi:hypothetical protein